MCALRAVQASDDVFAPGVELHRETLTGDIKPTPDEKPLFDETDAGKSMGSDTDK